MGPNAGGVEIACQSQLGGVITTGGGELCHCWLLSTALINIFNFMHITIIIVTINFNIKH
jgi:hypothetical protein